MKATTTLRGALVLAALSLTAAACGSDDDTASTTPAPAVTAAPATEPMTTEPMDSEPMATEPMTTEPMTTETMDSMPMDSAPMSTDMGEMMDSTTICSAEDIVAAVEGGDEQGTLDGMTDDPVATAASNNPVLTTLTAAVGAAGLVDTLNSAEGLTVFAPTDCAFAALDPATLDAALADSTGLLTTVLGFHVIPERLEPADLAGMTELTTFTGEVLPISVDGDTITLNGSLNGTRDGGAATVVVPGIQTANATVYLIDQVMIPPSVG